MNPLLPCSKIAEKLAVSPSEDGSLWCWSEFGGRSPPNSLQHHNDPSTLQCFRIRLRCIERARASGLAPLVTLKQLAQMAQALLKVTCVLRQSTQLAGNFPPLPLQAGQ